jgi:molybdopterin adenylyltransferase
MVEETRAAIIGVLTVSDRASAGVYEDESGPAIAAYLNKILTSPFRIVRRIVPDGFESVRDTLIDLADKEHCDLILTTGGTGPSPRDLTPEATAAAAARILPGFGELMRQVSLQQVPTAILSRQIAAHRGPCLVVNLPGKPASIETCLNAVFPAVPYCLDLIGAAYIETDPAILKSFRPKQS